MRGGYQLLVIVEVFFNLRLLSCFLVLVLLLVLNAKLLSYSFRMQGLRFLDFVLYYKIIGSLSRHIVSVSGVIFLLI